ncbi:MAG: chemotaxis protein CheW, partial [bacterium]
GNRAGERSIAMPRKVETKVREEVQLVVFRLQDEEFGVEIGQVREIIRIPEITKIPEAPGAIVGVINLRGEVVGVIDLAKQFDLPAEKSHDKVARIVVAEVDEKTFGMIVDEVPEVIKIAKDEIEVTPELVQSKVKKDYIKGVGKIGERLLILIDLTRILDPGAAKVLGTLNKEAE